MTEPPRLRHNLLQMTLVFAAIPILIVTATVTYPRVFMAMIAVWVLGSYAHHVWRGGENS